MTEGLKLLKKMVATTHEIVHGDCPGETAGIGMLNIMFECVAENLGMIEKRLDNLERQQREGFKVLDK